jgi:hypothetical protein
MKVVFWNVKLCRLVNRDKKFEEKYSHLLSDRQAVLKDLLDSLILRTSQHSERPQKNRFSVTTTAKSSRSANRSTSNGSATAVSSVSEYTNVS